jgi:hypothetical protein
VAQILRCKCFDNLTNFLFANGTQRPPRVVSQ